MTLLKYCQHNITNTPFRKLQTHLFVYRGVSVCVISGLKLRQVCLYGVENLNSKEVCLYE